MKIVFSFCLLWIVQVAVAQQIIYRNEMGGLISREVFEEKITNGPYFGVPGANPNEKALLHRMPFGKVEPQAFYEALGMEDALKARKSLIVIYYPGKDECNSTGSQANDATRFRKNHEYLLKGASKKAAEAPVYIYKNPHGLEKYEGIMDWIPDPEGIFEKNFFKYPYPCRSFVVIHPSGEYRSILGEFPESQVMLALKILNK
jgi:hypothetical protein